MEYKLNNYNKNIDESELIADLVNVSKILGKSHVSRSAYEKHGKYSATPFLRNFGSWSNALIKSGLSVEQDKKELIRIENTELIIDIQRVAKKISKNTVSTKDYAENGKYKVQTLLSRFESWSNVIKIAGLESTGFYIPTDEELFLDIEKIWINKGSQPTTTDIKKGMSKFSLNTYSRRFGGWRNALICFLEYVDKDIEYEDVQKKVEQSVKENSDVCKSVERKIECKHKTSRDINDRLRFRVLKRDFFKCCACGASPAKDLAVQLHIDHIVPWAKGGETVIENLQTLCSQCNYGKSDIL